MAEKLEPIKIKTASVGDIIIECQLYDYRSIKPVALWINESNKTNVYHYTFEEFIESEYYKYFDDDYECWKSGV